jgi:hypothetical protein
MSSSAPKTPDPQSKTKTGKTPPSPSEIKRVFSYWQDRLDHPKALLTPERRRLIVARLKDGYAVEELEAAIDGCKNSEFHMGLNDTGKVHDDITLIFRNGSKLEQFIDLKNQNGKIRPDQARRDSVVDRLRGQAELLANYPTEAELAAAREAEGDAQRAQPSLALDGLETDGSDRR